MMSHAPPEQQLSVVVPFPQLHKFRQNQQNMIRMDHLSQRQLGLVPINPMECHHINCFSMTTPSTTEVAFQVQICTECSNNRLPINLGTYSDLESAMFVNDIHEIMNSRFHRLLVLCPEDMPFLYNLSANKINEQGEVSTVNAMQFISSFIFTDVSPIATTTTAEDTTSDSSINPPPDSKSSSSETTVAMELAHPEPDISNIAILSELCSIPSPMRRPRASTFASFSDASSISYLHTQPQLSYGPAATSSYANPHAAVTSAPSMSTAGYILPNQFQALKEPIGTRTSTRLASRGHQQPNESAGNTPLKLESGTHFGDINDTTVGRDRSGSLLETLSIFASMPDDEFTAAKYLTEMQLGSTPDRNPDVDQTYATASLYGEPLTGTHGFQAAGFAEVSTAPPRSFGEARAVPMEELDYLRSVGKAVHPVDPWSYAGGRARSNSMPFLSTPPGHFATSATSGFGTLTYRERSDSSSSSVSMNGFRELKCIGIYDPEERKKRIQRFLDKRKHRVWTKKVKYDVRKNFADTRVRVKGRFVKKDALSESPAAAAGATSTKAAGAGSAGTKK